MCDEIIESLDLQRQSIQLLERSQKSLETVSQLLVGIDQSLAGVNRSLEKMSRSLHGNRRVSESTNNLLRELLEARWQANPTTKGYEDSL